MKRIFKSALFFLVLAISFSCSEQASRLTEYSLQDIISNSQPIALSEIGADIKTIKLKLPEDIILSQPAKIVTSLSDIFIQTRKPLQVYRFDRDGKFLNKISMQGRAKNEYNGIMAIFIDTEGNFCVQDGSKILTYNPDGKFLNVIEMKQEEKKQPMGFRGGSPRQMYMDKEGNLFESFMVLMGSEINNLIVTSPNRDTLLANLNPIRYEFDGSSISIFHDIRTVYAVGDEIAYQQQFRDTVFTVDLNTSSLMPRFHFTSPAPFSGDDYKNMHKAHKERIFVDDVAEDNKYIYARVSVKGEKQLYLIDKKTGESFKAEFGLNHPDDEDLMFYPSWDSNDEFIFYYDVSEVPEPTVMLMEKM